MTHPLVDLQPVLKPHAKLELRDHLKISVNSLPIPLVFPPPAPPPFPALLPAIHIFLYDDLPDRYGSA